MTMLELDFSTAALTVSEITAHLKAVVASDPILADIAVRGEISNFRRPASGHLYFDLKDERAILPCVMFRQEAFGLTFQPEDGMLVIARGRVNIYEKAGKYQLYVEEMTFGGEGALFIAFEQLKRRLMAEGLFDPKHKKPLPRFPRRIGVATSPTGAAIRDVLTILGRRYPAAEIYVIPTLVQGEEAPASIIRAIGMADAFGRLDVLILGRGGGSIEDLWCFNDEAVARAVFAARVPIVSAVGHETDFTIADFVADVRAPTPSAAAELVAPDRVELLARIRSLTQRITTALSHRAQLARSRLERITARRGWAHPTEPIGRARQYLDEVFERIARRPQVMAERLRSRLEAAAGRLVALDPRAVLSRGFCLARREEDGSWLKSVTQVDVGERIGVVLTDGSLRSLVEEVTSGEWQVAGK